jgi:photosystem II stability/assembly factor-like uncharacterized protein
MKRARVAGAVFVVLWFGLTGLFGAASVAGATGQFSVVQTFVKSGPVHSPSFISPTRGWAVVGNRLLHTEDGGGRWTLSVPTEWGGRLPEAISFADPTDGWAAGDHFAFATHDGGHTWTLLPAETPAGHAWLAATALDSRHVVLGASDGTIAGSDDGGATWDVRESGAAARVSAFWFTGTTTGFAVGADASGQGVLLATSDAGVSWQIRAQANGALDSVTFVDALHGWAAGAGALMRTTDGGASWVALAPPLPSGNTSAARATLAFTSDSHGFLGMNVSGAPLYETLDGGNSWNAVSPASEPARVSGLIGLGPARVLVTGDSLPAGADSPTARVWTWTQDQSATAPASVAAKSPVRSTGATVAAKRVAVKHAKKRPHRKVARHHKAAKHAKRRAKHAKHR